MIKKTLCAVDATFLMNQDMGAVDITVKKITFQHSLLKLIKVSVVLSVLLSH
jgi:hypothetical protein